MKKWLLILLALSTAGLILYSLSGPSGSEAYLEALQREREEKNAFMRDSPQSPFGEKRSSFTGLKYFEPDLKYRILAKLEPVKEKQVRVLPTSTGEEAQYLEYAWANFELDGVSNRLLLLEVMEMGPNRGTLFLAFADETSARETYGAGRYLDVKKIGGATTIELDFNKAYHPYCAYSDGYSCPLPPRENLLKVAIKAGERL